VDAALANPTAFAKDPFKAVELARKREQAQAALAAAEAEWMEAAEAYEALREA